MVGYEEKRLGPRFDVHPRAEEVGTMWGLGDFSGEIQTHCSVSLLNDWEDAGDRLVGIWVRSVPPS